MNSSAYQTLSPRELTCLRLVAEGLESKEIAARLSADQDGTRSLSVNTVDGYIKSGMAKLGVSRRRTAAKLVAEHEGTAPRWLGEQPARVAEEETSTPPTAPATSMGKTGFPWPLRRRDEVTNELGIGARLMWILIITIGMAIGFGSLASGLKVVVDLFGSSRLLSPSDTKAPLMSTSAMLEESIHAAALQTLVRDFERKIDDAYAAFGDLAAALPRARQELKLSAVVGQPVIAHFTEAGAAIAAARGHSVSGHRVLDKVACALGYETATGDEQPKPRNPMTTAEAAGVPVGLTIDA